MKSVESEDVKLQEYLLGKYSCILMLFTFSSEKLKAQKEKFL